MVPLSPGVAENFLRAHVYVDGGNFLKAVRKHGGPRFVDFHTLATIVAQRAAHVSKWLGMRCAVARVSYYDAEPDDDHPEREDKLRYFDALDRLPDVHVRHGFLRRASSSSRRTQKGVDVLLAVDMLEDAHRGIMTVAMLFSGDGDFAPLLEAVRQYGPRAVVVAFSDSLSEDLRLVADVTVELDKQSDYSIPELNV